MNTAQAQFKLLYWKHGVAHIISTDPQDLNEYIVTQQDISAWSYDVGFPDRVGSNVNVRALHLVEHSPDRFRAPVLKNSEESRAAHTQFAALFVQDAKGFHFPDGECVTHVTIHELHQHVLKHKLDIQKKEQCEFCKRRPSLRELMLYIGTWCERKGWNDTQKSPSEWAILAVTEIAEAFEEHRNGHDALDVYFKQNAETGAVKPEGQVIEYADTLIRLCDWFYSHKADPVEYILLKMSYNETRPAKHGGKRV